MSLGRRLPRNLECPVDNIFVDIAEHFLVPFKSLNFTPNGITTVALLMSLLSIKYSLEGNVNAFAGTYMFGYLLDCVDGMYARKYNMTSTFGDYYEHARDILGNSALFYFIFKQYKSVLLTDLRYIKIFSFFLLGFVIHMAQQQRFIKKENPTKKWEFLDVLKKFIPKVPLKITRWFGAGTFNLVVTALIRHLIQSNRLQIPLRAFSRFPATL